MIRVRCDFNDVEDGGRQITILIAHADDPAAVMPGAEAELYDEEGNVACGQIIGVDRRTALVRITPDTWHALGAVLPLTPEVTVSQYVVYALPKESVNREDWAVYVVRRSDDRWAVCRTPVSMRLCFSRAGELVLDEGDDDTRFTLDEALNAARRIALTHRINGMNALEVWDWECGGGHNPAR